MVILLADDDKYVRFSVKSMLAEIITDEYIFVDAKDGKALVEQCRIYHPDIAFVDISMPYLDGITGIDYCKKYSPETQFVVLTGHSDFSYAQRCISIGISEYVLKPIEFEQLEIIYNKLINQLKHMQSFMNSDFQVKIIHYFQTLDAFDELSQADVKKDDILILSQDYIYTAFAFYIDSDDNHYSYSVYKEVRNSLHNICSQYSKEKSYYAIFNSDIGTFRLVITIKEKDLSKLLFMLQSICNTHSTGDVKVSCMYTQGKELFKLYKSLKAIEDNQFIHICLPSCYIFDFDNHSLSENDINFLRDIDELIANYININEVSYNKTITHIYRTYQNDVLAINLEAVSKHILLLTGNPIDHTTFKAFCLSLVDMCQFMYQDVPSNNEDKVDQIMDYIDKNYMSDIGINVLAEIFEITPNYLSKIFHDKTGTKFIDYLTNVRITNAKRILLQNRSVLIKDVAVMVGYSSARHFSNVFRKVVGMYPAEFR